MIDFFKVSKPVHKWAKIGFIIGEGGIGLLAFFLAWSTLKAPLWAAFVIFTVGSFINYVYFTGYNDKWKEEGE